MEDDQIRAMLGSLSRPHPSGGTVVESAALLAAGGDYEAAVAWILDHSGVPEVAAATPQRGLHGRRDGAGGRFSSAPARFVLPPGTLV